MEALGYLDVIYTNSTSPLWPKVFFVARRGVATLRNALRERGQEWTENAHDRRRRNGASAQHVLHEVFIAEFMLMAWQTSQLREDLQILTIQRRSLATHEAFRVGGRGRQVHLQPDGMFLYRQHEKGMMCCLVELDLDSMSAKQIAMKMRRYQAWTESPRASAYLNDLYKRHGAAAARASFRLIFVVGSRAFNAENRRLKQLVSVASRCSPSIREKIWICTVEQLQISVESRLFLNAPIWLRLRDIPAEKCDRMRPDDSTASFVWKSKSRSTRRRCVIDQTRHPPTHQSDPQDFQVAVLISVDEIGLTWKRDSFAKFIELSLGGYPITGLGFFDDLQDGIMSCS